MDYRDIYDGLAAPFTAEQIEWRPGPTKDNKTRALAYIDARTVMERFDEVCGPAGWQSEHYHAGGERMACRISVWFEGRGWVSKTDGGGESDMEAEKGAFSIALRRAAVLWGVGRYLYTLDSPWVEIDDRKRIVKTEIPNLNRIHNAAASKLTESVRWGGRHARFVANAIRLIDTAVHHFVTQPDQAAEFLESAEGTLAAMPKAAQQHIQNTLSRVGARAAE